jgi:hypothetical protein
LGILLHQCESAALPLKTAGPWTMQHFQRGSGGWYSYRTAAKNPCGNAVIRELGGFWTCAEALSQTWARFFPESGPTGKYPPPFSPEFWHDYAEPVRDFLAAGSRLYEAVQELQAILKSRASLPKKQELFHDKVHEVIHSLSAPVRPLVYLESRSSFGLGWACGSLLSAFAMMAILDLTARRLLTCNNESCSAFFVSKAAKARYCSVKCRHTVQMRRYRNVLKQGAEQ